ncbi:complement C2-like isoform X2 [Narcine bancroftii]|uniref:complement C2-like isoform X2 n=1 Tax=Narcine bancroftii TaxID=1343680 RepID=UPI0038317B4D
MGVQLKMTFHWNRQPRLDVVFMVWIIGRWSLMMCEEAILCDKEEIIKGGWIKWPENLVERSVMTYICPVGFRPYPVSWRYCAAGSQWSLLRNIYGETAKEASCKEITCLTPKKFEFGYFEPHQTIFKVNETILFHCFDGFQLIGSVSRTCLPNGKWSGNVPRCNTGGSWCPNPGIPLGSMRIGHRFDLYSIVRYHCGTNILRGSSTRQCLVSGQWSGVEPHCENRYAFDNVKDLAKQLDILELAVHSHGVGSHKKGRGQVDFFFVIDVTRSLGKENFNKTFDFVTTFISRMSGTTAVVRFEVIAFGTYPSKITAINEELTSEMVIERIKGIGYRDYYECRGRRTGLALNVVYSSINETLNLQKKSGSPMPKQVIIIITHGNYNGAPSPFTVKKKITNLLSNFTNTLEIYAIGIGEVPKDYLERLVLKKETIVQGQRYAFYLPSFDYLHEAQEKPRKSDNTQTFECGIQGNITQRPVGRVFGGILSAEFDWPWQVNIEFPTKVPCGGSIISTRWILTAAHCFNETIGETDNITIWAGSTRRRIGLQKLSVEEVILHEDFRKPTEFNNDIALVKVKETIIFSSHVRPVCLPCTKKSAQLLVLPTGDWKEICNYEGVLLTSDNGRKHTTVSGYVIGWGYYKKGSKLSSLTLKHAQVYIQPYLTCNSPYPLTENMFCAKGPEADACKDWHHQFWKNRRLWTEPHGILYKCAQNDELD